MRQVLQDQLALQARKAMSVLRDRLDLRVNGGTQVSRAKLVLWDNKETRVQLAILVKRVQLEKMGTLELPVLMVLWDLQDIPVNRDR